MSEPTESTGRLFIPDILEEHIEGIGFLWGQWCAAIRSHEYTLREIADLEERIRSHVGGAVAVGKPAMPLLEEALSDDDRFTAFAAAYALLHTGGNLGATHVLEEFSTAGEERLLGLEEAMSYGPIQDHLSEINDLVETASPLVAAAAAEVLTFHGALKPTAERIKQFLSDENESVRRRGWRLVGHLCYPLEKETYDTALRDEAPGVKRVVLESGAWCKADDVTAFVRAASDAPKPENRDALYVFAVLGGSEDLPRFTDIVGTDTMGAERYHLAGTYGHPALMDHVIDGFKDPDPAIAAAAGNAFTKMTGVEVWSDQRVTVGSVPEGEIDEFETYFLDDVLLPDPELAQRIWRNAAPRVAGATRIVRGHDLQRGLNDPAFAQLDMESRWEVCLRAKFNGTWDGSPLGLEVFPQKR